MLYQNFVVIIDTAFGENELYISLASLENGNGLIQTSYNEIRTIKNMNIEALRFLGKAK